MHQDTFTCYFDKDEFAPQKTQNTAYQVYCDLPSAIAVKFESTVNRQGEVRFSRDILGTSLFSTFYVEKIFFSYLIEGGKSDVSI